LVEATLSDFLAIHVLRIKEATGRTPAMPIASSMENKKGAVITSTGALRRAELV
jgi:hypothetical protein